MEKSIFKFRLEIVDDQSIEMREEADILSVGLQRGILNVWAMVDPSADMELRHFVIFGTGNPAFDENINFLETVHDYSNGLVWHVFEHYKIK